MTEIPQAARDAADDAARPHVADTAEAVTRRAAEFIGSGMAAAMHAMLRAAAPHIEAAERERIATRVEACAANYPEDLFPPTSVSREAISGTAMRHAYRNAARLIREGGCDEMSDSS